MSERRISNYPEQMNGDGVGRMWRAVLTLAIEDLSDPQMRYDARQWLYGPDSDLCFACLGCDPEQFRARLKEQYPASASSVTGAEDERKVAA